MLVFGVLGYAMKKLGYSPAALTLALVLGPLAERALRQSLIISDAGLGILFMRPITAVLTVAALLAVLVPKEVGVTRKLEEVGKKLGSQEVGVRSCIHIFVAPFLTTRLTVA